MRFDVVTIFPEMFEGLASEGVVSRAIARGSLDVDGARLKSFTSDQHRTVDDASYGGGPGMVMKLSHFFWQLSIFKRKAAS